MEVMIAVQSGTPLRVLRVLLQEEFLPAEEGATT